MEAKITGPHSATNYKAVFYEAQAFLTAAVEINKKQQSIISLNDSCEENIWSLRNVEYVNHAFAVELLLKCVMILENERYYRGHNLFGLFEKLNSSTQNEMALLYDANRPVRYKMNSSEYESVTLKSVLKEGRNSFMCLRYTFEPGYRNTRYHLERVADLIVKYILLIKPELKYITP
jgi:HEPN domain-containing protein